MAPRPTTPDHPALATGDAGAPLDPTRLRHLHQLLLAGGPHGVPVSELRRLLGPVNPLRRRRLLRELVALPGVHATTEPAPSAGAALSRRVVLRAVHLEHPADPAPAH
ncbi:MAG: hypothetical protein R2755_22120 [Acidimicrobiales bacterium]